MDKFWDNVVQFFSKKVVQIVSWITLGISLVALLIAGQSKVDLVVALVAAISAVVLFLQHYLYTKMLSGEIDSPHAKDDEAWNAYKSTLFNISLIGWILLAASIVILVISGANRNDVNDYVTLVFAAIAAVAAIVAFISGKCQTINQKSLIKGDI